MLFPFVRITEKHGFVSIIHLSIYHISSVIRQSFFLPKQSQQSKSAYKTDLDLWDCLGRVKLILQQNFIGFSYL